MTIDPARRAELAKRMDDRRSDLGLRWREVAELAGMSYEGIRSVRKGRSTIPAFTRRRIEKALQWLRGEVDRTLGEDGGTGETPPAHRPAESGRLKIMLVVARQPPKEWPAPLRQQVAAMAVADIQEAGRELGKQYGADLEIEFLLAALSVKKQAKAAAEQVDAEADATSDDSSPHR